MNFVSAECDNIFGSISGLICLIFVCESNIIELSEFEWSMSWRCTAVIEFVSSSVKNSIKFNLAYILCVTLR